MSMPLQRESGYCLAQPLPQDVAGMTVAAVTTAPVHSPRTSRDPLVYLGLADHAVLIGAGVLCHELLKPGSALPLSMLAAMGVGALAFAVTGYARALYSYTRMENSIRQCMPFAFTFFQFVVTAATVLLFVSDPLTEVRQWAGLWFTASLLGMGALRILFWMCMDVPACRAHYTRKIVLIGASAKAEMMTRHFTEHGGLYKIAGLFVTDGDRFHTMASAPILHAFRQIPLIGSFDALAQMCREQQVDDIIITPELETHPDAETILKTLEGLPCSIKYCIPGNFFSRPLANVELISHIPVVTIFRTPPRGLRLIGKRAEDIFVSCLSIVVFSPVMALAALLVALDGQGQILFRQRRHGCAGHEFDIYKFRSMHLADSHETELVQATRNDARVTWVGKFLRRWSIDELPQLFNVLKGDMSMVGPRPHAVMHNYHYRELINGYVARQRVKPGITGWAQVNGWRGETETLEKMRKRVEHDLYYMENWSLWFDLKILILTAVTILRHRNAY